MTKKTSTLVTATKTPRTCNECRHANQGTVDFGEGRLFCWFAKQTKRNNQLCDVSLPLPKTPSGPTSTYFMFERFDGKNGTFDVSRDLRIIAEDADDAQRADLQADQPIL